MTPEQKAQLTAFQMVWDLFGDATVEWSIKEGNAQRLNRCLAMLPKIFSEVQKVVINTPDQLKQYLEGTGVALFGTDFLKIMEEALNKGKNNSTPKAMPDVSCLPDIVPPSQPPKT